MSDERSGAERAAASDPDLYYEDEEDEDDSSAGSEPSDSSSICSDDSVYPSTEPPPMLGGCRELSLYQCCARNDAQLLQERLRCGVGRGEATELDINGRNGLMVACCRGFVDIVPLLRQCPYVDVNQQDTEGNTALMMAAQAGHITIVNYLLNYFPALDVERRDARGLTALMKAAVQGRHDCVTALLLAGADLHAVDPFKGKTAKDWAAFTGRFETTVRIRTLLRRPRAEQFDTRYLPEWPALAGLVAKALSPKSRSQRLVEKIRSLFTFRIPRDPEEDGVLDHMVRMTTSLASPFVSTACRTICPDSPPEVGKRRLSVAEILQEHVPEPGTGTESCNGQLVLHGQVGNGQVTSDRAVASHRHRVLGFLPRLLRTNCIFPGGERVPRIKLSKASSPPAGGRERRARARDKALLQPPKWRYKELKEEKRAAEEAEGEKKRKKGKKGR
ncbi:hypothetical protein ASZ78_008805 [Callipepla squamata]|uniref:Uncharacterized protein n=1 Tax=Callipepla squamata TaxID=9009 RepID=A0A226MMR3_CALSU|nr:hypothetical protein ASZ78_008805 [Callipepla squamata]